MKLKRYKMVMLSIVLIGIAIIGLNAIYLGNVVNHKKNTSEETVKQIVTRFKNPAPKK
ncbi:MAG: hypothetical protein LBT80_00950 [Lactobacillaceae bacterium]|jgi:hypothetical protein|nr:hypothetical protein [Lactobacillaceae bacterium]